MRPVKLVFSAFGPYADKSEIDFEALGGRGLFLVTGPTGAGKTTIFDALTYALYGKASGDLRSDAMLRSHYADPKTPTYAHLTFEHNGKRYLVKRNPSYERPKQRGEGMTKETAAAELYENDKLIASKIGDVTEKIEDLLGITYDQFTQIAMIAQGDFRKVLTADTEERGKILRKVFGTEIYKDIEERLGEEKSLAEKAYKKEVGHLAQALSRAEYPENFEAKEEYDTLKEKQFTENTERGCLLLGNMIALDAAEFEALEEKRVAIRKKLDQEKLLIGACKRDATDREKIAELSERMAELAPKLAEARERMAASKDNDKKATELSLEIKTLEDQMMCWKEIFEKEEHLRKLTAEEERLKEELEKAKETLGKAVENLENVETKIKELKNAETDREKYRNQCQKWTELQEEFDKIRREKEENAQNLTKCLERIKEQEESRRTGALALDEIEKNLKKMANRLEALKDASGHLADAKSLYEKQKALRERYEKLTSEIDESKTEKKSLETKIQISEGTITEMKTEISRKEERIEKIKDADVLKIEKQNTLKELKERKDSLEILEQKEKAYDSLEKALGEMKDVFEKENLKRQKAEEAYAARKTLYFNNMAGILAKTLPDGEACPVCGSRNHPHLAQMSFDAPDKDALETEEQQLKKMHTDTEHLAAQIGEKKNVLTEKEQEIKTLYENLGISETLLKAQKENQEKMVAIKDELSKKEEEIGERDALRKALEDLKDKLETEKTKVSGLRENASAVGGKLLSAEEDRRDLIGEKAYKEARQGDVREKLIEEEAVLEEKKKAAEALVEEKVSLDKKIKTLRAGREESLKEDKRCSEKLASLEGQKSGFIKEENRIRSALDTCMRCFEEGERDEKKAEEKFRIRLEELSDLLEKADLAVKEKNTCSAENERLKQEIQKDQEEILRLSGEVSGHTEKRKAEETSLQSRRAKVAGTNASTLADLKAQKIQKKELLLTEKANSEKAVQDKKQKYENALATKETLEKGLMKEKVSLEEVMKRKEDLEEKEGLVETRIRTINTRLSSNTSELQAANRGSGTVKEKEKAYIDINALYETLTGKISGKPKIRLETYVQMIYFDQIVKRANRHFTSMSGGQYELKRRTEATDYRGKTGLDLDVMDYYSGRKREIKSLSGGEMFEASLSLALGLSDVIQENAGGISLEAMFIDEGFGTLDEDVLEKAMKVLKDLAEGDRLVGIISHVSELEERIPCQIVVTKDTAEAKTTSQIALIHR